MINASTLEEYKSLEVFEKFPWIGEIVNDTIPWGSHIDYLSKREGKSIFPMGLDKPITFNIDVLEEWKPYFNKFYHVVKDNSVSFFMGFQFTNTELVSASSYSGNDKEMLVSVIYYGTCYGDLYRFIEKYQDYLFIPKKERSLGFLNK